VTNHLWDDEYEHLAEQFDPLHTDRQARRKRKPVPGHRPKKTRDEIIAALADVPDELETEFTTTYRPSRYEAGWLLSSLQGFYSEKLIIDVLAQVKGGKEASVYRCLAHPATGYEFLAAKVYRPRRFRSLRNDAVYREGREVLNEGGAVVKKNDHRIMRALGKKTDFGVQVAQTSWLMYEYTTMQHLHQTGAALPRPVASAHNAILMAYLGDERMAAPTLNEVALNPAEAGELYHRVLYNVELMLMHDLIHGDLSAYNILYWEGEIALIDFPQVVRATENRRARFLLERDVQRVCEYFAAQGVDCAPPSEIVDALWERHVHLPPDVPDIPEIEL
jgi:RIO kinase 1